MKKFLSLSFLTLLGFLVFTEEANAQQDTLQQKLDTYLRHKLAKGNIPGFSVAIVHGNKIVFSKGYGKTGENQPVTDDTPFAIASLSKSFTAMAIMQLSEAGKIKLDAPIAEYFSSLGENGKKITVRQLLNQTSGYSDLTFPELAFQQQPQSLRQAIERMKNVSLVSRSGEKFHYHNPNYQVLARLVEVVSGESFPTYLDKNIFIPLKMKHTVSLNGTKDLYTMQELNYTPGHVFLFGYPLVKKEPDWFIQGSAGMISTANDMAAWLIVNMNKGAFENHQLLSPEGIKEMQTPYSGGSYAMGWISGDSTLIRHNGILWTSQAEQVIMKDKGYGIVILFNSGLSAFQDYGAFTRDIAEILTGGTPELSAFPTIGYEIITGLIAVIAIIMSCRRLTRGKQWRRKYAERSKFLSWLWLLLRLTPLALLLSIPQIGTSMSGRVLSWERIFWAMPSIVIFLSVVSVLNVIIVGLRIYRLNV